MRDPTDTANVFRGSYQDKSSGGGYGGAARVHGAKTFDNWSSALSEKMREPICLHCGTFNVKFDRHNAKQLEKILKARLGNPFAELCSVKTDAELYPAGKPKKRNPFQFHKVQLYLDGLSEDGCLAFLWYPRYRRDTEVVSHGRLEFVAPYTKAALGDPVSVDLSDSLRGS